MLIGPESRSGRNQDGEDAAQFEMAMISIRDRPSSQHEDKGVSYCALYSVFPQYTVIAFCSQLCLQSRAGIMRVSASALVINGVRKESFSDGTESDRG